jgi:multidrug resistance efflux pump
MTTDASAGLTRYDIYMHSDEIQFLRACPDGDYVKHAEADALLADLRGKLAEKDARIAQLEAELAAATKDARRYAVLRKSVLSAPMSAGMTMLTTADDIDSQCDQIDAAIAATQANEGGKDG